MMSITRPSRRDLLQYGIGAATLYKMSRAQVRIPGPGGVNNGGSGGGSWSFLTSASAASSGGSDITTPAINTTGANLIVAGVASGANAPAISDSRSNIWARLNIYSGGPNIALFYCYIPIVGSGHTFSTTSSNAPSLFVAAFAGASSSPLDQQDGAGASSGITAVQPGSITPGQSNELIVTFLGIAASGNISVSGVNQGFTIAGSETFSAGNNYGGAMAYLIQSTAAAVDPTWIVSGSASLLAAIASFK